ncbi:MAG: glycosyl hydrolase [Planctomycetota bacterium]
MYSETAGSRKTLGDIDIIYHDGIYHLFHLVLPNHDFIAHAVSNNCLQWRRVENALFIGDPGSWDDSMLWTMHVSRHPFDQTRFRMFYTGLSRRDHGKIQRIGMAESDNLYEWKKSPVSWTDNHSELPYELPGRPPQPSFGYDAKSCFPLSPDPAFYEANPEEDRHWISWRDPFYYRDESQDRGWLLIAGRTKQGPLVRRGCVAALEETSPNHFEARPALHHPGLYDDVEVPNLFRLDDEYYLVGSMREDAKIRYWHTPKIGTNWRSYSDNVLLAAGNYAGRVSVDDQGPLLWSFFTPPGFDRTTHNLMPPPKRIERRPDGRLKVKTFERFDELSLGTLNCESTDFAALWEDKSSVVEPVPSGLALRSPHRYQLFAHRAELSSLRLESRIEICSDGKCGIFFRANPSTHDGYYVSLDLFKGVAQCRSWGSSPDDSGENLMRYRSIQSGFWFTDEPGIALVQLIAYGTYIELSINGSIILSLADQDYQKGCVGFYIESGTLTATDLKIHRLDSPVQTDGHLANG